MLKALTILMLKECWVTCYAQITTDIQYRKRTYEDHHQTDTRY